MATRERISEFEYSPEICHFGQIQVLAKMTFFGNAPDSPDSPTFAKPCCWTRQTRERQVWRVLREFGKSGEFGECRLDRFMQIKYVICAKNDLSYHAGLRGHLPSCVARTRQTHRDSPKAIFEKNVTCLAKFSRLMRESREFGASSHCLEIYSIFNKKNPYPTTVITNVCMT
jgi:hypothetical protein